MITKEEFNEAVITIEKYLNQTGLHAKIRPSSPKTFSELQEGDYVRCIHVAIQSKNTYTKNKLYMTSYGGAVVIKNDRGQRRGIRGAMLNNFEVA